MNAFCNASHNHDESGKKKHPITRLIFVFLENKRIRQALASFFKAPTKLLRFRFKTQTISCVFAGHPL